MTTITLETTCPICGGHHYIDVPEQGLAEWMEGELIQNALPMLNADEREMLISGICPRCWGRMFGEDE